MNNNQITQPPKEQEEKFIDPELGEIELIAEDDTPEEKRRKRDETDKQIKEVEDAQNPTIDTPNK